MDINKLPDPTIIVNQDNRIIKLNDRAKELGLDVGMLFEISYEVEVGGEIYSVSFTDLGEEKVIVLRKVAESDFYRTLFELSPDAIIIHDGQKILFANKRAAEVAGIPLERLIGMPVFNFIHPEYVNFVAERMKKMFQEKSQFLRQLKSSFCRMGERSSSRSVQATSHTKADRPYFL